MSADAPLSLSARLRAETRDAHQYAESSLNVMSDAFARDDYVHLLRQWLGFARAWEPIARRQFNGFWTGRDKSAWLEADLRSLGAELDPIQAPDPAMLRVDDQSDALGILYVTEGATLGGVHIARRLSTRLGVARDHGAHFLTSYGDETVARWAETKAFLDHSNASHGAVVESARRTFQFLAGWLPRAL